MGISVEAWKKTRIEDAEGSGVAKAIVQFEKAWPKKLSEVDQTSAPPAFEAIKVMRKALTTAEEKCKKAAKADPKKRTATLNLIGSWRGELDAYEDALHLAYGKALTTRIANRVIGTLEQVVPNSLEEIESKTNQFEGALKQRDLLKAYKRQTDASKSVRVLAAQLTPKGVKEQIGYACRDLKLDVNVNNVPMKECMPKHMQDWKRQLEKLDTRFESLEIVLDKLEASDDGADAETAAGSPEYKKNLKLVIADYTGVITTCQETMATILEVQKRFTKLQGMADQARKANPKGFDQAVQKMREIIDKQEQQMKTDVEKIRTKDGEFVKRKTISASLKRIPIDFWFPS